MLNIDSSFMDAIVRLAKQAGEAIIPFFKNPKRMQARHKADKTPVTEADLAAHVCLQEGLEQLTPGIPILSEEGNLPSFKIRQQWQHYWLLDPLDGTRGFLRGCDEFSVNIAFIENQQPVLGVIYAPILKSCYFAFKNGAAYRQIGDKASETIQSDSLDWTNLRLLIGQYHSSKRLNLLMERFKQLKVLRLNSSLKFCKIAEGGADIYPRYGPTGEWDTGAGQCILQEAGGLVVDLMGQPLHYNARDSLINPPFLAVGDPSQVEKILQSLPMPNH